MKTSDRILLGVMLGLFLLVVGAVAFVGLLIFNSPVLAQLGLERPVASTSLSAEIPTPPGAPKVGQPAPDFSLKGLDQKTVQLSQFWGKPVVVNFWATWCAPCSSEMPNIEKSYQEHSTRNDVAILAVNQLESADQVRGYADLYHLHFSLLLDSDGQIGQHLYHVQALPTTVFIDSQGIIKEIHVGGPMSFDFIEGKIQSLLR